MGSGDGKTIPGPRSTKRQITMSRVVDRKLRTRNSHTITYQDEFQDPPMYKMIATS